MEENANVPFWDNIQSLYLTNGKRWSKKKKETFIDQFMKSFENECLVKFNRWLIFDDINYRV